MFYLIIGNDEDICRIPRHWSTWFKADDCRNKILKWCFIRKVKKKGWTSGQWTYSEFHRDVSFCQPKQKRSVHVHLVHSLIWQWWRQTCKMSTHKLRNLFLAIDDNYVVDKMCILPYWNWDKCLNICRSKWKPTSLKFQLKLEFLKRPMCFMWVISLFLQFCKYLNHYNLWVWLFILGFFILTCIIFLFVL